MQPQTGNKSTRARAIIACTECHRRRKRVSLSLPAETPLYQKLYTNWQCAVLVGTALSKLCSSISARRMHLSTCPAVSGDCIGDYAPVEMLNGTCSLKRRSAAGRAAKRSTSSSTLKDATKEEAATQSMSDDDVSAIHPHPGRALPLLVHYVASSPAASDSRSKDSEWSCNTPETDHDEVDKIDWNSLTYSKSKGEPPLWKEGDHTPSHGELCSVKQDTARSSDAPSLPRSFGAGCMDLLAQVGVEPSMNNVELFKICECITWREKLGYAH